MGMHGGMRSMINAPDEKPKITWHLLKRVLHYAKPYRCRIITILLLILTQTGLMLLTPLIIRDLLDRTIPSGNVQRLMLLAVVLLLLPERKMPSAARLSVLSPAWFRLWLY